MRCMTPQTSGAESPAQQAAGRRCADESAWRNALTHL